MDDGATAPVTTLNVTGTPSVGWPNWFSTDTVAFLPAKLPANPRLVVAVDLVHGGDDQRLRQWR